MGDPKRILPLLAGLFLAMFAGMWIWIGVEILLFDPSEATPTLTFSQAEVTVAGFLASAVGAGTASVLGIEIQKAGETAGAISGRVAAAIAGAPLLIVGLGLYALVGVFVLAAWVFNSEIAPDMAGAFSLGVLGWFGGAFAAVFRAD
jgi:hypothetical protein